MLPPPRRVGGENYLKDPKELQSKAHSPGQPTTSLEVSSQGDRRQLLVVRRRRRWLLVLGLERLGDVVEEPLRLVAYSAPECLRWLHF